MLSHTLPSPDWCGTGLTAPSLKKQNNNKKKSLSTIIFVAGARQTQGLSNSLRLAFSSRLGLGGLKPQVLVILCMWEEKREGLKRKNSPVVDSTLPSVRVVLLLFPQLCLCCCLAEYLSSSVSVSAFSG